MYETDNQTVEHPIYETDEEEFMPDRSTLVEKSSTALNPVEGPDKSINTTKRNVSVQKNSRNTAQQYQLAYVNVWWVRRAVEGKKEVKERRKREEEESRSRRKRNWFTPGRKGLGNKDAEVV